MPGIARTEQSQLPLRQGHEGRGAVRRTCWRIVLSRCFNLWMSSSFFSDLVHRPTKHSSTTR